DGVHLAELPRADPDHPAQCAHPSGELRGLPRGHSPRADRRSDHGRGRGDLCPLPLGRGSWTGEVEPVAARISFMNGRESKSGFPKLAAAVIITAALTFGIAALLVTMIERKTEAKNRYLKFVEVTDDTTDPAVWGTNWPTQYDQYQRTVDVTHTRYGGSEAMPEQRLDRDPWLKRLYSGYAFSLDYRDRRGHAYMLSDQLQTERVKQRPQPGACLHCHSSVIPTYRRLGREAQPDEAHGDGFDWPAVFRGFELVSAMPYADAYAELTETSAPHPVSCVDCHDPES